MRLKGGGTGRISSQVKRAEIEQFLSGQGFAPGTVAIHVRHLEKLIDYAVQVNSDASNATTILGYLNGLRPHAKLRAYCVFRDFFTWRILAGKADYSPMIRIPAPRAVQGVRVGFTREQLAALVEAVDGMIKSAKPQEWFAALRMKAIFLLAIYYGLRTGEILGMNFGDWNPRDRILLIRRKTGHVITLQLHEEVNEILLAYVAARRGRVRNEGEGAGRAVFVSWQGRRLSHFALLRHFEQIAQRAGVELKHGGLHQLRHTMAGIMHADGATVSEVAQYLGHVSVSSTDHYLRHHFGTKSQVGRDILKGIMAAAKPGGQVVSLRAVSGQGGPEKEPDIDF